MFTFCCTKFCHFSGNFRTPFPKLFSFWAKVHFRCLWSSRKLKCFPVENFVKTEINGHLTVSVWWIQWWIRTSQPSAWFYLVILKKHVVLHCPDGRQCVFCWLIMDAFHQIAAFSWSNWEQGLVGIYTLIFQKELIIGTSFQSYHIHNITSFNGWRLAFGVVGGITSLLALTISSIPH